MNLQQWLRSQWDRVGAFTCIGVGLLVLLAGWIGVSGESLPSAQIPYILSGGMLALVLVGIGTTGWLSADLRDEWRKLDDLEELLEQLVASSTSERVAEPQKATAAPVANVFEARRTSV